MFSATAIPIDSTQLSTATANALIRVLATIKGREVPPATTKPKPVTYLPLSNPADMSKAMVNALTIGYRGTITAFKDPQGVEVWTIELNGPGNPKPVTASFGEVLVWDQVYLRAMPEAEFLSNYTV